MSMASPTAPYGHPDFNRIDHPARGRLDPIARMAYAGWEPMPGGGGMALGWLRFPFGCPA
jgi:hypothetical protein